MWRILATKLEGVPFGPVLPVFRKQALSVQYAFPCRPSVFGLPFKKLCKTPGYYLQCGWQALEILRSISARFCQGYTRLTLPIHYSSPVGFSGYCCAAAPKGPEWCQWKRFPSGCALAICVLCKYSSCGRQQCHSFFLCFLFLLLVRLSNSSMQPPRRFLMHPKIVWRQSTRTFSVATFSPGLKVVGPMILRLSS